LSRPVFKTTSLNELVEFFRENAADFCAPGYKEARARSDLINPLFELLDWDVRNRERSAEAYREVVIEDSLEVEGRTRAPDYCFRIGQAPKFFVEAKKPATGIKDNSDAAYQLRRYAWSANLQLSILTNFREFAAYDGRIRPKLTDSAATARVIYLTSDDYASRWREISGVFSKKAILKGSFDRYAGSAVQKRGTDTVDGAFLEQMEEWRRDIARVLALRNPALSSRDLNYSVQALIDRTLFLRICEEGDIEPYGRLKTLLRVKGIYPRLVEFFQLADDRYNSGLFHFADESKRPGFPDRITPGLDVDDDVLRRVIEGLYYPDSPYEFSVIPAEILGQVYERFLGSVIRLTPAHQAKVEQKPEVREAGGVFYTPRYIVDSIVRTTIEPRIKDRAPDEIAELRVLDPACGSGSFLLGAYKYLMGWYLDRYVRDGPRNHKEILVRDRQSGWRLSDEERKRILLTHLYGVDIDSQAVEVTKLSLLLEVLRAETRENIERTQKLFHQRALPDLDENIKCGNTLIGSREIAGILLDEETRGRVNPFDYPREFPTVYNRDDPGFDVIVGNPPYVRVQALNKWAPLEVGLIRDRYASGQAGNYDLYVVFVERALELLRGTGSLGLIVPNKFLHVDYGAPLREELSRRRAVARIVHFGTEQVFENATTYTCLLYAGKAPTPNLMVSRVASLPTWRDTGQSQESEFSWERLGRESWNLEAGADSAILEKLNRSNLPLGRFVEKIFQGIATSADSVFVMELVERGELVCKVRSKAVNAEVQIESDLLRPVLKGAEIVPWQRPDSRLVVLFPYTVDNRRATGIPIKTIESRYPLAYDYLSRNRQGLLARSKTDSSNWWLYPYPKNLGLYGCPKILSQVLSQSGAFTYDSQGEFCFLGGGTAGGNAILVKENDESSTLGLMAILNSPVTSFFVSHVGSAFRGGFHAFGKASLERLPLPEGFDISRSREGLALAAKEVIRLVGKRELRRVPAEREALEREIESAKERGWGAVARAYGLSQSEWTYVRQSVSTRQPS
jgi:hypothetical protein